MDRTECANPLLSAAATGAGSEATEALELQSNESRLAILLALREAHNPYSYEMALPFTALQERVGTRDSGKFNYHLGKLQGAYVTKSGAGYSLRP